MINPNCLRSLILLTAVLSGIPISQGAEFSWSSVFPNPPSVGYSDAVYGEGVWVMAGANLIASTGDDGATWSTTNTGGSNDTIDGVLYTGERFIAFGQQQLDGVWGVLLWESSDGFAWSRVEPSRISATGQAEKQRLLGGAVSDDGQSIIIGGFQGALFRSVDGGDSWTAGIYIPDDPSGHAQFGLIISDVAFGNGAFVFLQHGNDPIGLIINTSTDSGATWNYNATGATMMAETIAYGGGEFVIAGTEVNIFAVKSMKSPDGFTWTTHESGNTAGLFYDIEYGDGIWIAAPSWPTNLQSSTDGITWTPLNGTGGSQSFYGVGFGNGTFIAAGSISRKSTDGATWTRLASGPEGDLMAATYGNGTWVSVGTKGSILYSTDDGLTWSDVSPDQTSLINAIIWDGSQFVGIGNKSWVSPNGMDWTSHSLGFFPTMQTLAFGNGVYFAAGENMEMRRSTDGKSWTTATLPVNANGRQVVFGDDTFLLVTENWINPDPQRGQIFISSDGETWTQVGPTDKRPFKKAAYGNGTFVVLGLNQYFGQTSVYTSTDTVSWTESTLMMDPGHIFHDGNRFVVVGARIYTSFDGIQWTVEVEDPVTPYLTGAAMQGEVVLGLSSVGSVYRATLETQIPGAFDEALSLGSNWYRLDWFGMYFRSEGTTDWIFHEDMGWFRIVEAGTGLWLWSINNGWIYTDSSMFPYAFSADNSIWWIYDDISGWGSI
jgi:hypothetical protein